MTVHDPSLQHASAHEEMLESLEMQLVALYEEKQQAAAGEAEIASMRETISSLEAQVVELYREKEFEEGGIRAVIAAKDETIASLEAQLVSLYGEKAELRNAA
jgi:predicted  nucleic acid-binding Zn-ribbon protein